MSRTKHPEDLRVGIVAADALVRVGLTAALAAEPGVEIVFQLAPDRVASAPHPRTAAVVWDFGPRGLDTDPPLEFEARNPLVVLVADAERTPAALDRGARGVLLRDASAARIVAALRAAAAGLVVLDPLPAAAALRPRALADDAPILPLTPRELEVLQLLARGLANKEIAHLLDISEHTAKFHVNSILAKLGVARRTEAVVRAARLGLVVL